MVEKVCVGSGRKKKSHLCVCVRVLCVKKKKRKKNSGSLWLPETVLGRTGSNILTVLAHSQHLTRND